MIILDSVEKRYAPRPGRTRGTVALRDVSLAVPAGGITAIVGPNGAGKSTLFGLLLGFLRPSAGAIRIAGEPPRAYVGRHGVGYLPERFSVPRGWTTAGTLRTLGRLGGLRGPELGRRTDELLRRFELADRATQPADELSRGLLQRLGLAQALLAERELVVLDEPTEGLDPVWRVRLRELLRRLAADGRTVLLASHDLAEVERLADRAILLHDGTVREVLEPAAAAAGTEAEYRLRLRGVAPEAVTRTLPGAEGTGPGEYVVRTDAAELSRRLAALLELGGVIESLVPLAPSLEDRVRGSLAAGGPAPDDERA